MKRPFRYKIIFRKICFGCVLCCAVSCTQQSDQVKEEQNQSMMTKQSENLLIIQSKEGNLSYRFRAPLVEEYELAAEPYIEFRKGIEIETYNDSTHMTEATLTANYAIFFQRQELWEAKGNVQGHNAQGNEIETEQLFWNQKTKRIYSNVDSKIIQKDNVVYADRFESNDQFNDFVMTRVKGKVLVDAAPKQPDDSLSVATGSKVDPLPKRAVPRPEPKEGHYPVIREGEAVARPKQ